MSKSRKYTKASRVYAGRAARARNTLRKCFEMEECKLKKDSSISRKEAIQYPAIGPYKHKIIKETLSGMLDTDKHSKDYLYHVLDEYLRCYLHNISNIDLSVYAKEHLSNISLKAACLSNLLHSLSRIIPITELNSIAQSDCRWSLDCDGYFVPPKQRARFYPDSPANRLAKAHHAVERLAIWSRAASRRMPNLRGRKPNTALHILVRQLVNFWHHYLDRPVHLRATKRGSLQEFVITIVKHADPSVSEAQIKSSLRLLDSGVRKTRQE